MVLVQKHTCGSTDRIGGPEASPCARSQSICDKGGKNVWWRKDSLLSGAGETGQLYVKKKGN